MSAAGLVFASAGFCSVYAWSAGAPYGYLMAGLTVLMACGLECAKPLAVASALSAFRGFAVVRGAALALLAVVAVAYSLTAELSLMATARGDLVAQRAASAKAARARMDSGTVLKSSCPGWPMSAHPEPSVPRSMAYWLIPVLETVKQWMGRGPKRHVLE